MEASPPLGEHSATARVRCNPLDPSNLRCLDFPTLFRWGSPSNSVLTVTSLPLIKVLMLRSPFGHLGLWLC